MYVKHCDCEQYDDHEAMTNGFGLCSGKTDPRARITLPEDNRQILTPRYPVHWPTEDALPEVLEYRRRASGSEWQCAAEQSDG